jgi:tetratricopeptide (TPR) repeat protein
MAVLNASNRAASLDWQLNRLEQANLIRMASAQPELEYMFRHVLVQESACHTLVRADRRCVHSAAGEALKALYAGREQGPEIAPQLARHFEEADDDARAMHYYTLAGDAALARYATVEAVAAFSRALACAERSSVEAATWQHLFTARGRALELNSQFAEALRNYRAMGERALALGDRRLALTASVAAGQLYATATTLFDPTQAERMAEAALAEARALDDEEAEAKILWNRLNLYRFTHRDRQARESGEQSLEIARRLGLQGQAALALNDLMHVYANLGMWSEARRAAEEAGKLWRELGNLPMLADSLSTAGLNSNYRGEFASALRLCHEAYALCASIGNHWGQAYSLSGMGWPYWYMGEPQRAIESTEECIRLGQLGGYRIPEVFDRLRLAFIFTEMGDAVRGLAFARQALEAAEQVAPVGRATTFAARVHAELRAGLFEQATASLRAMDEEAHEAMIWEVDPVMAARAEVALAQGDAARAVEVAQARVHRLRELRILISLPEALTGLAHAVLLLGRVAEARESLIEALARARAMGAIMIEWLALHALGELEVEYGNPFDGEQNWAGARDIVRSIVARTPTEMRRSFLARPELRALFGDSSPVAAAEPPTPAQPAP